MKYWHNPEVYVTQFWPAGFCPDHYMTDTQCTRNCLQTRMMFAKAARDLDRYWLVDAKQPISMAWDGRDAA